MSTAIKKPAHTPRKYNYTKKTGRPRKTLEEYGLPDDWKKTIYDMSAKGCSAVEIQAHFVYNGVEGFNHNAWDKLRVHDVEFKTTINKANILCQAWWEKAGRQGITAQTFNTGCWYANMKNRFGWRDKVDVDHGLQDNLIDKFNNMSVAQLESRYKEISRN